MNRPHAIVEAAIARPRQDAKIRRIGADRDALPFEIVVTIERCRPSWEYAYRRHALRPAWRFSLGSARTRPLRLRQISHVDVERLRGSGEIRMKIDDDALLGRCGTEDDWLRTTAGQHQRTDDRENSSHARHRAPAFSGPVPQTLARREPGKSSCASDEESVKRGPALTSGHLALRQPLPRARPPARSTR